MLFFFLASFSLLIQSICGQNLKRAILWGKAQIVEGYCPSFIPVAVLKQPGENTA